MRRKGIPSTKKVFLRTNETIRVKEVRLINFDGTQIGIVPIEEALRQAQEAELDLVEVAPDGTPPVCKIIDYRKLLYDQRRREREARKHRRHTEIKEVKMRPMIDRHDYDVKLRRMRKFIEAGHKVKVTVMFRGREMAHQERGRHLMQKVVEDLAGVATMEDRMIQVGRQQHMLLMPSPQSKPQDEKSGKEAPSGEASS